MKIIISGIIIFFWTFSLGAQDKVFLQTARISGSGGAVTADADDFSTFLINPAGASLNNSIQLFGDYSNLYSAGFNNSFLGLYYPCFHSGGAGFCWQRVNYSEALGYKYQEDYFHTVLSKDLKVINAGINIKYNRETIESEPVEYQKTHLDYDLGILRHFQYFGLGLSILNLNYLGKEDKERSYVLNTGVYGKIMENLKLCMDYRKIKEENLISTGVEYYPLEELCLRSGWYKDFYYAFGMSYSVSRFRIDYAYMLHQHNIGDTHYFGINYFYSE